MPRYRVTENPPPFTEGPSSVTEIDTDLYQVSIPKPYSSNRLVDSPNYNIVQTFSSTNIPKTVVNTTVINQTNVISGGGSVKAAAEYVNTQVLTNITSRTLLSNNGGGANTYDDNQSSIWDSARMKITPTTLKEVLDIQLRFRITTDTLGGAFEIEAFNGEAIDIIEEEINIQEKDFTVRFKIVVDQKSIDDGIQFFITPELGMTVSIKNFSLLIIKG